MSQPLVICDCDEVLLHMVSHFGDWLDEAHDLDFVLEGGNFIDAVRPRDGSPALKGEEIWPLLNGFFDTEMDRQTIVPGASEALVSISEHAEIVILTNLQDEFRTARARQLQKFGIDFPVHTNQGGKGNKVQELLAAHAPSLALFVDDLGVHHESVARSTPKVWRLHMIAEPSLAPNVPPATHAHARIDDWHEAQHWIIDRITEGESA
ncbi:HAD family hydrolase [Parasphingopyxis lamellibrachiae]|uniref:HAD family hydrolase n=1 Tax=Parasphingopyxis lamellibrachiae TaxID=680125 RepID=A0A3D9FJZ8_9SPHN|nr:HAD family hydrolase [Parasphingopyxis lamellibrachiae]RED17416.1 hypothetical protein DFR46_2463 [Parasphingopyxis lamellibrachiae]